MSETTDPLLLIADEYERLKAENIQLKTEYDTLLEVTKRIAARCCPVCGGQVHWRTGACDDEEKRCPYCGWSDPPEKAPFAYLQMLRAENAELKAKLSTARHDALMEAIEELESNGLGGWSSEIIYRMVEKEMPEPTTHEKALLENVIRRMAEATSRNESGKNS